MGEHFLLPHEALLAMAILVGPPLLAGVLIQLVLWRRTSTRATAFRFALAAGTCALVGTVMSALILVMAPQQLLPLLGPRDLAVSPVWVPIFPGAFLAFAVTVTLSQRWLRASV